ncbi:acyl-phosphate glycerol-3-phosphate acyltransferase [Octadecabacter temperatus]|jgi:glycerol-3-phosphate acyltransferase PlsY|uniref:Glycerol-3-phosphate acyltransferase n=1 Tax=Octadecabacter temperatus TaxID=1458307 RepID=A0A0K0Y933_9RHOB|nr:glycerol-3-phosphate 1-O-acyltransferase PlsY [Octadecabacter temperatus]AKS47425.1 putative glycerol-3-phosphate acyltransferase [Octadecabacter temperatus]SIO42832.1 acyl-phosphate glycerol-3-phosphate acyltransferase [Octadecabacter temperatus]
MPNLESAGSVLLLWAAIAYFIGSIPFGLILARVMGLGNLRDIGSGNIGATNVLRTGSKKAAILTLLLDAGKGAVVVLLARKFAAFDAAQVAAFFVMLGHCFPVWLKFRGGKGVATFLGLLYALAWPVGIAACLTWLVTAAAFRFSSLAALVAAVSTMVWAIVLGTPSIFILCSFLTALIFWRHAGNIRRLFAGEESKIGQKSA